MSDLVKRLRQYRLDHDENVFRLRYEAADRIEALEAENKALREDAKKLYALEAHGVDNWDGYDFAMDDLDDE